MLISLDDATTRRFWKHAVVPWCLASNVNGATAEKRVRTRLWFCSKLISVRSEWWQSSSKTDCEKRMTFVEGDWTVKRLVYRLTRERRATSGIWKSRVNTQTPKQDEEFLFDDKYQSGSVKLTRSYSNGSLGVPLWRLTRCRLGREKIVSLSWKKLPRTVGT